jgi:hypothetical protein
MTSPTRLSWAAAHRWFIATGIVLVVLAGVLVALLVTHSSAAAAHTPVQRTTTIENHCTGISRDKPC